MSVFRGSRLSRAVKQWVTAINAGCLVFFASCDATRSVVPAERLNELPFAPEVSDNRPSITLPARESDLQLSIRVDPSRHKVASRSIVNIAGEMPGPDLIWYGTAGNATIWRMNDDTWNGEGATILQIQQPWRMVAVGDMNGDASPDLVWESASDGMRAVVFLRGAQYAGSYAMMMVVPLEWRIVATADFNDDDKPDIVIENTSTGDHYVLFMNGATYSGSLAPLLKTPLQWRLAAIAEMNGDGLKDMIWENIDDGTRIVTFMNGTAYTGQNAVMAVFSPQWRIAAAADFNHDRHPDLVVQNTNDGQRRILFASGGALNGASSQLPTAGVEYNIVGAASIPWDGPPVALGVDAPDGVISYGQRATFRAFGLDSLGGRVHLGEGAAGHLAWESSNWNWLRPSSKGGDTASFEPGAVGNGLMVTVRFGGLSGSTVVAIQPPTEAAPATALYSRDMYPDTWMRPFSPNSDELFLGGYTSHQIIHWSNNSWNELPRLPVDYFGFDTGVFTVAVYRDYAGGMWAGGWGIWKLVGSTWVMIPESADAYYSSIASFGKSIVAVGGRYQSGYPYQTALIIDSAGAVTSTELGVSGFVVDVTTRNGELLAAGDYGRIWRLSSSGWSSFDVPAAATQRIESIWSSSDGTVYVSAVTGDYWTLFKRSGDTWSAVFNTAAETYKALGMVRGRGSAEVYAVSGDGLFTYDGLTWTKRTRPEATGEMYLAVPSTGSAVFLTGAGQAFRSVGGGSFEPLIDRAYEGWARSVWPSDRQDIWLASDPLNFSAGGRIIRSSNGGISWSANSVPISTQAVRSLQLWGIPSSHIYAMGNNGAFYFDWTAWQFRNDIPAGVTAMWGSNPSDVWASSYALLHWNGTEWSAQPQDFSYYRAMWGSAATDVYAVGQAACAASDRQADNCGIIKHFDGSAWTTVAGLPSVFSWFGINGTSASDIYAVGYRFYQGLPVIVHFDGSTWTPIATPGQWWPSAVWHDGAASLWVTEQNGDVRLLRSGQWFEFRLGNANLRAVTGTSPAEVYFVGDNGVFLGTTAFAGSVPTYGSPSISASGIGTFPTAPKMATAWGQSGAGSDCIRWRCAKQQIRMAR